MHVPNSQKNIHPPKQTWNLKMGAPWKFGDSYWKPSFPGSMLVFGGSFPSLNPNKPQILVQKHEARVPLNPQNHMKNLAREVAASYVTVHKAMKSDLAMKSMNHLHLLFESFNTNFAWSPVNSASFVNTPLVFGLVVVWIATRQNRNGKRHRFASFLSPSLRGDNSTNDAIHSSQLESATCWCPFARHGWWWK